ncbi:MAG: hypothetical protein U0163_14525 [Gemmatimonadaceae bacterium]
MSWTVIVRVSPTCAECFAEVPMGTVRAEWSSDRSDGGSEVEPAHHRPFRRVLFISNGAGEDDIGARLAQRVRQRDDAVRVDGWPMVGDSAAYAHAGVRAIGPRNQLPGEGFGTLHVTAFARDLRAGWLRVHREQLAAARTMRGQYDLVVAVGDVVPLAAAAIIGTRCAMVGCAKSVYYGTRYGFNALERWLLRRANATTTRATRVRRTRYAAPACAPSTGEYPMMDGLDPICRRPVVERTGTRRRLSSGQSS